MTLTVKCSGEFDRYPRRSKGDIRSDPGYLRHICLLVFHIFHELSFGHDRICKPHQDLPCRLNRDIIRLSSLNHQFGVLNRNYLCHCQIPFLGIYHLIAYLEILRGNRYAVFARLEHFSRRVEYDRGCISGYILICQALDRY